MITIFGATGFTGAKVARQLDRAGLPFRIAGRSAEKLAQLSASLPSNPPWLVADAADSRTLPPLFLQTRLLINCAGPFTDLGERIVTQAAVNGVHYLDSTNELGFVYRIQSYGKLAAQKNAVIVPACAFEVALADCAASLLAAQFPGLYTTADVVYHLPGSISSLGTRLSSLRSLSTSWIAYRNSGWTGEVPGHKGRRFQLSNKIYSTFSIPSAESVSLPGHLQVKNVTTWMTGAPGSHLWAPVFIPYGARLMRTILGKLVLWIVSRGKQAKAEALSTNQPFEIQVNLSRGPETKSISLFGCKPYDLTAEILAYAADFILQPDYNRCGFLSPACALDPSAFLRKAVADWGITLQPAAWAQPNELEWVEGAADVHL